MLLCPVPGILLRGRLHETTRSRLSMNYIACTCMSIAVSLVRCLGSSLGRQLGLTTGGSWLVSYESSSFSSSR
jgi:hypothetical protein